MKRWMLGIVLTALTAGLCGCARQVVWETVTDGCTPSGAPDQVLVAQLPEDAAEEVFAEQGAQRVYVQPGGGYEIVMQTLPDAPAASIVRQLSGFSADALHVYETTQDGFRALQFAWYAAGDEGGRVYRAKVLRSGAYCYALTISVPEGSGTSYDSMTSALLTSMDLAPAGTI